METTLLADPPERDEEWWLEQETRDLPMPNGSMRPFTCMRIHWGSFDFLVHECGYTPERLVELAVIDAQEHNKDLDIFFPDTMAFIDQEIRHIHEQG